MRSDPAVFAIQNEASTKKPRFVIGIEFDVESVYLTSHAGISGVPGVVIENVLRRPSAVSQRIVPDEGRSEIGSFTFSLIDLASAFTLEIRDKLGDGKGLRGKKVRFWVGYSRFAPSESGGFGEGGFGEGGFGEGEAVDAPDAVFSEFQLFQTQIITNASYDDGVYTIQCADITREQRADIFEPKKTTLRDSIDEDDTTIPVYTTTGFQPVYHGSSYSDGPNGVYGYIKVDNEWIRYPFDGITPDSFTNCVRGRLNTKAVAHAVDANTDADRRPKVEEGIYLELPAVKLVYAILTGIIHDTFPTQTLPEHWHLGIDPSLVRLTDMTGIGTDLWDTTLDTEGFVVRFQGLSKITGKKFLETELYMLLGCYSPIYSDGTIGLKRMNQVLADAAFVTVLDSRNIISHGALDHDMSSLHNRLQIDWNWNGDRFTRSTVFIDAQSIATHGAAPLKKLQFKGLHGSRHTEAIIRKRMDSFRDRYTAVPETTTVSVLSSLNRLEVGDAIRDRMPNVRDYAGSTQNIDRSFEIQRRSCDYISGDVTLELFGSTGRASVEAPNGTGSGNALPDAFYNAAGTELSTVATIVVVGGVGVIQAGTYNLTAGTYYYLGDLELADGATLTINGTVQIRVRGFFTINGVIDGVGRGKAGVADSGGWTATQAGTSGFLGISRGMDGVLAMVASRGGGQYIRTQPCAMTQGQYAAFPYLDLSVSGSSIVGIPADLAGTSGGAGGKIGRAPVGSNFATGTVTANGGTGANSGAGLILVGRGLAFGASGSINLSGNNAASTSLSTNGLGFSWDVYPGPGGAGCPGGLLVLLDGSSVFLPDLGGHFTATCGSVPIDGTPLPQRGPAGFGAMRNSGWAEPGSGYLDESYISGIDLSNVAYRVQYLPGVETPQEDAGPPTPTGFIVTSSLNANVLTWIPPHELQYDVVEVYASSTNNRTNALLVERVRGSTLSHASVNVGVQYYWIRSRDEQDRVSAFNPESATAGLSAVSVPSEYHPIGDPRFALSADQNYWIWGAATGVSISLTGGVLGGRMIFAGDGSTKAVYAYRTPLYHALTGQQFTIYVRWRRTTALTYSNPANTAFGIVAVTVDDVPPGVSSGSGSSVLTGTQVDAVNINEWQEFSYVSTTLNLPKNQAQLPYWTVHVDMTSNVLSGTIEVDSVVAVPF